MGSAIQQVYDHHTQHVQEALTDIQHDHHDILVPAMHVHLDHHNCLEVFVVRGKALQTNNADNLIVPKGVKHGKLTMTLPA